MALTFTRVLIETDTGLKVQASADTRIFFNPSEYQLERRVDWKETNNRGVDLPQLQFDKGGRRSLKMSLTFDTYESLRRKVFLRTCASIPVKSPSWPRSTARRSGHRYVRLSGAPRSIRMPGFPSKGCSRA